MAIYKFSNAGGFANYTRYNDFLAGNPAVILDKGSMFPLGVFTLSSAQATIEFTNIPQTYTHLQIRGVLRNTTGTPDCVLSMNNNAITRRHFLFGDGSTAGSGSDATGNGIISAPSTTSNVFGGLILDVLDYKDTNKNKTVRVLEGYDANGSGVVAFNSYLYATNTNAITSIRLTSSGTNFAANSSIALYGVL